MKDNKWLRRLIKLLVTIGIIALIVNGINSYLASRSVTLTFADIYSAVMILLNYILALFFIIFIVIIVSLTAFAVKNKAIRSFVRWQAVIALMLSVLVIINLVCLGPEYGLVNNLFSSGNELSQETIAASEQLVQEIANEGVVLIKNDAGILPMNSGTKLNVFGWASTNPVYGGSGSGSIDESTCITLLQGLQDAGYELNTAISDFYTAYQDTRPVMAIQGRDWTIPEPTMAEYDAAGIFENAKAFSDTAVIVIARIGGENADLPTSIKDEDTLDMNSIAGVVGTRYTSNADDVDPSKSYLELNNREVAMVERVTSEFDNVIVIINSANAMELGWLNEYDSIKGAIWLAGPGQTGFEALGKVLNGEVNPSARLVDTFVYDLHDIPAFQYIGDLRYDNVEDILNTSSTGYYASFTNYVEGIYVGYKFYETAAEEGFLDYDATVLYPFGYGLSYTSFEQSIENISDDDITVTVTVSVTNTGKVPGKEVVQVYFNPPYTNGGIEKASVNLIGFEKTDLLAPGESTSVTVSFAKEDMASYDYSGIKAAGGAYVLEAGEYEVSIRANSHTVIDTRTVTVAKDIIYNNANDGARASDEIVAANLFDYALGDVTYLSRADGFANYAQAVAAPTTYSMDDETRAVFFCEYTYNVDEDLDSTVPMPTTGAKNGTTIRDVAGLDYDDPKWDGLLDNMSVNEMNTLIATGGYASARVTSIDLPATVEGDGPQGIKNNYTGQSGTGFPTATMIAATWNKDLAKRRGQMMGRECEEMNVAGWYGPAMNIHRTPFAGRNFEYYSEDGVLSGYMGASEITGAREYGLQAYMKHFALNDCETNRTNMLCTWTNEQAMREIYLKPFEMSVKMGGTTAVMSSFNYIGARWAGTTPQLLNNVLRDEWGFRGVVVTDWFGSYYGYMVADSIIRAGGDKMLSSAGDRMAYATNLDDPSTVAALREANHNILYSIANSNAMNERNFGTPAWMIAMYAIDFLAVALIALLEWYEIRRLKKNKSAQNK